MTASINIRHYPIFDKGFFNKHPELFDRFFEHTFHFSLSVYRNIVKCSIINCFISRLSRPLPDIMLNTRPFLFGTLLAAY